MKRNLLTLLAAIGIQHTASAEQLLFTGQVQSITLQPSGIGQCAPPCGWPEKQTANGLQRVCITNMGGCQNVSIMVLTDHLGRDDGKVMEFASRYGEWGRLSFPNTPEPILVYAHDGKPQWARLAERDGTTYVDEPKGQRTLREFIEEFQAQSGKNGGNATR
jgi:hypothetical protein